MKLYFNHSLEKKQLKKLFYWFHQRYGSSQTRDLADTLKTMGFHYATYAGISLAVDDLEIPPLKGQLVKNAEKQVWKSDQFYERGEITSIERFQKVIEAWSWTSENVKEEVLHFFQNYQRLNPVYMMAFSGARGNISQVRQLVGMRGLMSDPQGNLIDVPIKNNFREGLTIIEYVISCYGARKGIVDTALKTANSGYLTRRLVEAAQAVTIYNTDCHTNQGQFLSDLYQDPSFSSEKQTLDSPNLSRLATDSTPSNSYSSLIYLHNQRSSQTKTAYADPSNISSALEERLIGRVAMENLCINDSSIVDKTSLDFDGYNRNRDIKDCHNLFGFGCGKNQGDIALGLGIDQGNLSDYQYQREKGHTGTGGFITFLTSPLKAFSNISGRKNMITGVKQSTSFRFVHQDNSNLPDMRTRDRTRMSKMTLVYKNEEIKPFQASHIAKYYHSVRVRSPLTCSTSDSKVCQLCYGWDLSQSDIVSLGEVVGIIAAQSIGEPGTQLTMRTFHTGGVFAGDVGQKVVAPSDGYIYISDGSFRKKADAPQKQSPHIQQYSDSHTQAFSQQWILATGGGERGSQQREVEATKENSEDFLDFSPPSKEKSKTFLELISATSLSGRKVRTQLGENALITYKRFYIAFVSFIENKWYTTIYEFPSQTLLFVTPGEYVEHKQIIAEIPKKQYPSPAFSTFVHQTSTLTPSKSQTSVAADQSLYPLDIKDPLDLLGFGKYHGDLLSQGEILDPPDLKDPPDLSRTRTRTRTRTRSHTRTRTRSGDWLHQDILVQNQDNCNWYSQPSLNDSKTKWFANSNSLLGQPTRESPEGDHTRASTGEHEAYQQESQGVDTATEFVEATYEDTEKVDVVSDFSGQVFLQFAGATVQTAAKRYNAASRDWVSNLQLSYGHSYWQLVQSGQLWLLSGRKVRTHMNFHRSDKIEIRARDLSRGSMIASELSTPAPNTQTAAVQAKTAIEDMQSGYQKQNGQLSPILTQKAFNNKDSNCYSSACNSNYSVEVRTSFIQTLPQKDLGCLSSFKSKWQTRLSNRINCIYNLQNQGGSGLKSFTASDGYSVPNWSYWKTFPNREVSYFPNQSSIYPPNSRDSPDLSGKDPHDLLGFGKDHGDLLSQGEILDPPDISRTRTRTRTRIDSPNLSRLQTKREENTSTGGEVDFAYLFLDSTVQKEFCVRLFPCSGSIRGIYDTSEYGVAATTQRLNCQKQLTIGELLKKGSAFFTPILIYCGRNGLVCADFEVNFDTNASNNYSAADGYVMPDTSLITEIQSFQHHEFDYARIKTRKVKPYLLSKGAISKLQQWQMVDACEHLYQLPYNKEKTGDIVQGLPKIDQFFEARKQFYHNPKTLAIKNFFFFRKRGLSAFLSTFLSFRNVQNLCAHSVQRVYQSQGISLSDKHIEIIVRRMTSYVLILHPGNTSLLPGEVVEYQLLRSLISPFSHSDNVQQRPLESTTVEGTGFCNNNYYSGFFGQGKSSVIFLPYILGITKVSLSNYRTAFLSAASFQETRRILMHSALESCTDYLDQLKQPVMLGKTIPAGIAFFYEQL